MYLLRYKIYMFIKLCTLKYLYLYIHIFKNNNYTTYKCVINIGRCKIFYLYC